MLGAGQFNFLEFGGLRLCLHGPKVHFRIREGSGGEKTLKLLWSETLERTTVGLSDGRCKDEQPFNEDMSIF